MNILFHGISFSVLLMDKAFVIMGILMIKISLSKGSY